MSTETVRSTKGDYVFTQATGERFENKRMCGGHIKCHDSCVADSDNAGEQNHQAMVNF